ncbi:hypothetical protein [Fibrella aquatilis]|uniref:Uncharacterized protein n=1 Tax=Fibrella aquatilis TaxID=2817059 RepID=A0A939K2R3_9BACT|nr:hypothetical protein [Fibrella aquatilis]MBO0934346.1 hypothetical protein [Fibrella aquatilis]
MKNLREGIRARYRTYQQRDPDRYPNFEFNTNRANYEPLRESFEEEFYRVRGYDAKTPTIAIPSTSTLAQLFTDDSYVPSRKILNTCESYAEGPVQADNIVEAVHQAGPLPSNPKPAINQWLLAAIGTVALVSLCIMGWRAVYPKPSGLVITRPIHRSIIPRENVIEGRVFNAKTVRIVLLSVSFDRYWITEPIQVNDNGVWQIEEIIGSHLKTDIGQTYQLRAFVNLKEEFPPGEVYPSWSGTWPEAELASNVIDIVRGPAVRQY